MMQRVSTATVDDVGGDRLGSAGFAARIAAAALLALSTGCSMFNAPRYHGPKSDHFDGERFHNQGEVHSHEFGDILKWQLNRQKGPWREWTDAPFGAPPPRRVGVGELRVTFINHATTLVQVDGLNILTDPVWSDRVGPLSWAGPMRRRPPGIRFEDLPPIDVVLISHNHYDHLDLPTLERIGKAFHPRFFVPLGNAQLFHRARLGNVVEVDWWDSVRLRNGVKLNAVPAQHRSNRGLSDESVTLWAGYVIEGSQGYTYFAGDTGFGPHYEQIRTRFGSPRLAILPIGAYRPEWFMSRVHMSPSDAVRAHQVLGATRSVGIHFGTFALADDGQDEPVEGLAAARQEAGLDEERFWVLDFGEGRDVPPALPGQAE